LALLGSSVGLAISVAVSISVQSAAAPSHTHIVILMERYTAVFWTCFTCNVAVVALKGIGLCHHGKVGLRQRVDLLLVHRVRAVEPTRWNHSSTNHCKNSEQILVIASSRRTEIDFQTKSDHSIARTCTPRRHGTNRFHGQITRPASTL